MSNIKGFSRNRTLQKVRVATIAATRIIIIVCVRSGLIKELVQEFTRNFVYQLSEMHAGNSCETNL
jgi:hypothetical protein